MKTNKVVYAYFDGQECFYIGIGIPKRPYQMSKSERNNFTLKKIKKAKKKKSFHIQILHSGLNRDQAIWYEISYIKSIGRRDLGLGTLTNLTDGGEGTKSFPGYWKGKHRSEATKEKLRQANTGKILPKKQRQDLSKRWKTDLNPMRGKTGGQHNSSKPVMTPKGRFESVVEAATAYNTYQQQIGYWCRTNTKKYKEFYYV